MVQSRTVESGSTSGQPKHLFSFRGLEFDYDPYPIGYVRGVFPDDVYREMTETYPPVALFAYMPKLGKKYSLSESNNRDQYYSFLGKYPVWRSLYQAIKSPEFVAEVLEALYEGQVDVGLRGRVDVVNDEGAARRKRFRSALECLRYGIVRRVPITTRFEFSMLPADGGHIKPHTDNRNKLITLVMSCMKDDEWDPALGGGTAVLKPKDVRKSYNHVNKYLEFDETHEVKTFPFSSNQCLMFVKTFNSLHAVFPMTGADSPLMRKTLTVNLETF